MKNHMFRRGIALLLALALVFTLPEESLFAETVQAAAEVVSDAAAAVVSEAQDAVSAAMSSLSDAVLLEESDASLILEDDDTAVSSSSSGISISAESSEDITLLLSDETGETAQADDPAVNDVQDDDASALVLAQQIAEEAEDCAAEDSAGETDAEAAEAQENAESAADTQADDSPSASAESAAASSVDTLSIDEEITGTCGSDLTYTLSTDGILTISGTGAMTSYSRYSAVPWYDYAEDITSVVIESGVTDISKYAFYGLSAMTQISVPDGVTSIGNYAFYGCSSLTSVDLPDSVTSIGNYAFSGCSSLTSVDLPDNLTSISSGLFDACTALTSVNIPDTVTSIGSYAFYYCKVLTSVTLPDTVTSIGNSAFYYCLVLSSVNIPDGVTSIGNYTFYNCKALTSIEIPDTVTSIGSYAFYNCRALTSVEIPDSVTSIASYAFDNCRALTSVTLPDSITSVSAYTFAYCIALENITLPEGLTEIGDYAFYDCYSLETLELPESLETIGTYAFRYCSGLSQFSVPSGVTQIGTYAFANMGGIQIVFCGDAPSFGSDTFYNSSVMAYYIDTNTTWTSDVLTDYSASDINWISYTEGTSPFDPDYTSGDVKSYDTVELVSLDSDLLSYTSSSTETTQIANEYRNGIYFLSGTKLQFYSLEDGTFETVYNFAGCTSTYATEEKLYVLYSSKCYVYNLNYRYLEQTVKFTDLAEDETITGTTAVGADASGRIYLATYGYDSDDNAVYQLRLYTADGELLSCTEAAVRIYRFDGFTDENGYFFMDSYYNWVYWGYDHPGRGITMGQVTDNEISYMETSGSVVISGILYYSLSCLEYACQSSYYLHQKNADVTGGKYLVTTSVTYGRVNIADTDTMTTLLTLSRDAIEEAQDSSSSDLNSIGVRVIYNEANDSIIAYENDCTLNEYDPETCEIIGTYKTAHYVFNLLTIGDNVIVIEHEDGNFYMEILSWKAPDSITIEASSSSMQVGESQQLSVGGLNTYSLAANWSSSDSSVVSVTDTGKISAWSTGSAVITCALSDGSASAKTTITVTAGSVSTPSSTSTALSGTDSTNISDNNYTKWSSVVNSYLTENDDGTLMRVEYTGSSVLVETYSSAYKLTSTETLSAELSLFGGFYAGEDYNYLVFGQTNYDEDDDLEVIRVVKYSKDWERISACALSDINTYIPFDAGSLRMTEVSGSLYIYTCHEMYESSDGYHHQANMTFVIDEDSMTLTDSYTDIMNNSYGYVSHSFNQFIQTDGTLVYRSDHGDAYPRGIYLSEMTHGDSVTSVSYGTIYAFEGSTGANATGASEGGMELSDDNILIVGNSVDMSDEDSYSAYGQRNIFLLVTDQEYFTTSTIWLTDYSSADFVTPRTPQLVKISDDQFLIMWEEYYSLSGSVATRMVTVNGEGTITSDITCADVRLSDCQPIVTEDGLVTWYVTDGDDVTLYTVNPYDLPNTLNPDDLNTAKISDADITLSYTSCTYSGSAKKPTVTVEYNGDVLTKGTNYTVTYSDNTNAGTAKVTIKGIGNFTGSVTKKFTINQKSIAGSSMTVSLSATTYTYNGKAKKPSVTVKFSSTKLTKGTDYTVTYASGRKSIGKYKVTIKGTGNYKGTVTKYFKIKPGKVKLKSSTKSSAKKKLTVKWSKLSGSVKYQIAYKKKGASSWSYKKVSASTVSATLTGLTSGKYYYVKVRAYKKVNGTTYYGSWSTQKTVKVK